MYSENELYRMHQECRTPREFVFLTKWLKLLIEVGLVRLTEELRKISLDRFRQLENLENIEE